MTRIKERKKHKDQLSDRKSLAAQQRMKSIATLASDSTPASKRRKRGNDDTFGAKDEDWAVYRQIGGDDSGDDDDEAVQLKEIETRLLKFDPNFTEDDTAYSQSLKKTHLIDAFVRGIAPGDSGLNFDPENPEQNAQLHVNIERLRVPEVLYQPSIAGIDQAGLLEIVESVLRQQGPAAREILIKNIFITGGNTLTNNFMGRFHSSLRSILPVNSSFSLRAPKDISLDTWYGMQKWSRTDEFRTALVTRRDYGEMGMDYIRDHRFGNTSPR